MGTDFEKTFSEYLEGEDYDWAEQSLFVIVRAAYKAGWRAAGGEYPQPQETLKLIKDAKKEEG